MTNSTVEHETWVAEGGQPIGTAYRNHPQVRWHAYQGEESCHVDGVNYDGPNWKPGLWVRESFGRWLVDHPDRERNERFATVDEAITWALQQVGGAR